ncbi:helix-turn-helix transcriptional regulator [Lentilactobacillus diolivorans]|uniref:Transcriptional regulator n=1 Tax=Lentilactobacillus diolivorans TaxID=179838 RepID=A0ABQ0XB65_9LACO|nr:helix-turn-helix transcriptional regulator [Lentilactobacillus diolivorans]GEP23323.1 transcriptional regulator [Lentilactobacillus diolivorans]
MIVNRLKVYRAANGWTQQDLADRLGVTRQTIAAVENGKYSLSLKMAFDIAKAFGVQLQDVFQDADEKDK